MIKYVAGSNKGETKQGDVFNSPFALGKVDVNYTSEAVTEAFATGQAALAWTPVVTGQFTKADGTVLGDVKVINGSTVVYGTFAAGSAATGTLASMTFVDEDGSSTTHTFAVGDKIAYKYDNVVIPQNDLPILNAKMESIPLVAKARRIAVYYKHLKAVA